MTTHPANAKLRSEGWCVVPDVLDPAATADALALLWEAAEETRRRGGDTHIPMLDPNDANIRVFRLLDLHARFRELIRHPAALELVHALLGPSFLISNFTANIARPGARSMALHSDQSLVVPAPWLQPWSMNVIWCLTDLYFENGATLFIPGSHLWRTREDVPPHADKLLRPFEAKAGSIVAMDGRVWHTSGANITKDSDRALLFGYYSAPFLRPQVNWNAGLSEATKAMLDPQMQQWLGLGAAANTGVAQNLRFLEEEFPAG